jgi:hypothetical protein
VGNAEATVLYFSAVSKNRDYVTEVRVADVLALDSVRHPSAMRRNSLGPIDYFLFFSSASRSANGW